MTRANMAWVSGLVLYGLVAVLTGARAAESEFLGPFPSWRDLKRDYGAVGDGQADDTAALQRALDDLAAHQASCVLYLPAGTYRLTNTVRTLRQGHTDYQGVAVIGEHPERTILRWDGPEALPMFMWDAWYAKISRLAFDGGGRAETGLLYGPAFSTYNETSDLWFRGVRNGIVFGGPETAGQAENAVLRCRFAGCEVGVQTVNWNSMDIWVWHSRFEDCSRSIHNVMGNWHAWQNLFLRSTVADVSIANLMAFSVVGNVSVGSRCFLDFSSGHTWGAPTSITGNRIIDPTGDFAMLLDTAGPYLVVDNLFRLGPQTRGIRMTWGDQTLVGNRYTRADAVEERGRFRRLDEQVVVLGEISTALPDLPGPPPHLEHPVIEVPVDADGAAIQTAINQAASRNGERPVVHLPMGNYAVSQTLVIPAHCDLQLVGDAAGETGTRLNWTGADGGPLLRVDGPSQASLRDLFVHAPSGRGIVIANADQPGGRILADQLNTNGPGETGPEGATALRVSGLEETMVLCRALQGNGNAGRWVEVLGGPSGGRTASSVAVLTGATGSAAGQYDVRAGGRLVVRGVYHERSSGELSGLLLADRGTLSIDATRFSYETSAARPTIATDGFRGLFTLATCMLLPVATEETCRFELRGDGAESRVLCLNNLFWVNQPGTTAETVWRNLAEPPAQGGMVGCNVNGDSRNVSSRWETLMGVDENTDPARSISGSGPLANAGMVTDTMLLEHLKLLRETLVWLEEEPVPSEATDLQIHRVMVSGGLGATVEITADN